MITPSQLSFKKWYEKNRLEFNAQRRKRYQTDKVYRIKQKDYASLYRKNGPANLEAVGRYHFKLSKKGIVMMFTISYVAAYCKRSISTIKNWRRLGYFPGPAQGRKQMFSHAQVAMVWGVGYTIKTFRYNTPYLRKRLKDLSKQIRTMW